MWKVLHGSSRDMTKEQREKTLSCCSASGSDITTYIEIDKQLVNNII